MPDDLNRFARDLFDGLPARYDRLAELLSFGQNGQWRSEMTRRVAPRGNQTGACSGAAHGYGPRNG